MKFVTFKRNDEISCGILGAKGVSDICSLWTGPDAPRSIIEVLERGEECIEKLKNLYSKTDVFTPLSQVKLLAPIPRPGKVIGLAGNYSEHIKESGLALGLSDSPRNTTTPRPFLMPSTVVIGPEEEIPWPVYSEDIDYELELAVVIGKKAKCVSEKDALDYVAGYTIANDVSARSVTFKEGRAVRPWDEFYDWLNGKWADGFCPIGPCIVTKDEIGDVQNLNMELTVNGEIKQKANTGQMIYSVADTVSFISQIMTLEPGDIIATGTVKGVGMATKKYLNAGDLMELRIDKIGILRNRLGARPERFFKPLV
jgi:2-keto-4-pentenoate hydratase/2-oxohepta-3-ene-1,7-dioic acid hydratase in catechol pathway